MDNEALELLKEIDTLVSDIEQRLEKLEKRVAALEVPDQEQPIKINSEDFTKTVMNALNKHQRNRDIPQLEI